MAPYAEGRHRAVIQKTAIRCRSFDMVAEEGILKST